MKEQVARTQQKVVRRRPSQRVKTALPLLPMRGIVVFPYMVLPLPIGREVSIRAVERALAADRRLLLVAQQQTSVEEPLPEDLYDVGTIATVLRWVTLPNGHLEILVQGQSKVRIDHYTQRRPYLQADFQQVKDIRKRSGGLSEEVEALIRQTREKLERLFALGYLMPPDILILAENVQAPGRLADAILSNLELEVDEAQPLLEQRDPLRRLSAVGDLLEKAFDRMVMQHHVRSKAQENMTKTQREYFLREQLRTIQQELGEVDGHTESLLELRTRIDEADMPPEVEQEGRKQLGRLERMQPESSEANLIHTYLEWLLELPWRIATEDCPDLHRAHEVLDADHYGLERVKERILEFLSMRKLNSQMPGPILCFVGAPGVGKTSLGSSIARALGRKFVRLSLGGVRDEAEIRGHRRTYVGAMPGRIAQSLRKVGVINPVFLLDEVDKMGRDGHGDPTAALLEVLDPEQNHSFSDHYLGVPVDLSQVMFIATANVADAMPSAFRDRLELIHLEGYNDDEKLQIALRHLLPRQVNMHGVAHEPLRLSEATLRQIITGYTREAGVRQLERALAAICRKVARQVAEGQTDKTFHIHRGNLSRYLGVQKYVSMPEQEQDEVGVALGLAWSESGGEVIHVEATAMPGKGQLVLTGQLGEVMQESARAALSYMRTHADALVIKAEMFNSHDLHIHVPAGGIPKDGPSAGVTMASALLSALTGKPLSHTVAMTGEITLRGQVLAVGGVKDKVLAAERVGLTRVILPQGNQKDLEDIPAKTRRRMHFIFANTVADVFATAFQSTTTR
ncbi:endopeptidase La [Candidatus Entotheonella palauensis]|nr:endopeptidase La [Candidatus Entotheonella palauensis]